ncbi:hypothetical protein F4553_006840 [Allocatelliglobosispora scoriae]|uniref:Uncharacterized protein n=1 Tax=Allocatelliglobosispora scoriae TaxID=643052 RepID=A0A841C0M7_9ACTN|nr:hypothetical protein [Allocatelliglobosispora scoriae]MBB5873406.1 hypothetical protein [Allocatelliglobosispora scoriae]
MSVFPAARFLTPFDTSPFGVESREELDRRNSSRVGPTRGRLP